MTDPVTAMTALSIGASGGGSILSGIGEHRSAKAKSQMYGYQAGMADLRQKIALQNRDFVLEQGGQEQVRYGLKARFERGRIVTSQAASGFDVGSGSNAAVQESQRKITQMDLRQIGQNAARRAYGYMTEAEEAGAQAGMYRSAAADAKKAGKLAVAASILSGVSSVSGKWAQASQSGMGTRASSKASDYDPTYSNYGFGYT